MYFDIKISILHEELDSREPTNTITPALESPQDYTKNTEMESKHHNSYQCKINSLLSRIEELEK